MVRDPRPAGETLTSVVGSEGVMMSGSMKMVPWKGGSTTLGGPEGPFPPSQAGKTTRVHKDNPRTVFFIDMVKFIVLAP
jgi:hypothetical protein